MLGPFLFAAHNDHGGVVPDSKMLLLLPRVSYTGYGLGFVHANFPACLAGAIRYIAPCPFPVGRSVDGNRKANLLPANLCSVVACCLHVQKEKETRVLFVFNNLILPNVCSV